MLHCWRRLNIVCAPTPSVSVFGRRQHLIAFVTEGTQIEKILNHIDVNAEPPHLSLARRPQLRDDCGCAQINHGAQIEPDWELAAQPAPDFDVGRQVNW